MCNLDDEKTILKIEISCASDGVVETTKTSLPCSPAVDQSVSWISRAISILLSRIPCKIRLHRYNNLACWIIYLLVDVLLCSIAEYFYELWCIICNIILQYKLQGKILIRRFVV